MICENCKRSDGFRKRYKKIKQNRVICVTCGHEQDSLSEDGE